MKERGIIFRGDGVRGILDDLKNQTRRVIKPQPIRCVNDHSESAEVGEIVFYRDWPHRLCESTGRNKRAEGVLTPTKIKCPYGEVGDRLWVRETFEALYGERIFSPDKDYQIIKYLVDNKQRKIRTTEMIAHHKHPSIHMPRWASRILLEITDIRVERVQDISEEDVKKEGIWTDDILFSTINTEYKFKLKFKKLWNLIYAKWKRAYNKETKTYEFYQYPWDVESAMPIPKRAKYPERYHCVPNPYVWAITFKKLSDGGV